MILENINRENDIKNVPPEKYNELAAEIREFLIDKISQTGGHLASNLGVVELTMALHLSFDLPKDKIIWDVGHQAYTHKILTGRKAGFDELRSYGGMSGFPKRKESKCDPFNTGHSSTSLSAGLGYAYARDLKGEDNYVVSVIGDGALTGGMAIEAINNAANIKKNYIMVLNDNNMSISENVGALSVVLGKIRGASAYNGLKNNVAKNISKIPVYGDRLVETIRTTKSGIKQLVVPGMMFEDMGITYLGPFDGHNIEQLTKAFKVAKKINNAVLVHVVTKKGKGYAPAEKRPSHFHGVGPFVKETGLPKVKKVNANYTDVFSKMMMELGEKYNNLVAISAAMPDGTGLKRFQAEYPDRFFDVGIAEEHAVTFAAGLAAGGMRPVVAIYSSFLQRAYDQILHDVCIQNLPVIFAIDRAGIVGNDGETHQGIFDLSFLSQIPNMTVFAPKNKYELKDFMRYAMTYEAPIAVRYPRGEAYKGLREFYAPIEYGKSEMIYEESDIALFAAGNMVKTAVEVRDRLKMAGYNVTLVNARFVKPFDEDMIRYLNKEHRLLVTMEENVISGGMGMAIARFMKVEKIDMDLINIALPDDYVEHGNVDILKKALKIDSESISERIMEYCDTAKED